MKKYNVFFYLAVWALTFFACKKEAAGPVLNLDAPVDILSYKVDTANGIIDTAAGTITIHLPFGTDFTKVAPQIGLPAEAVVSPASGATVSLKSPLRYRVVNGNIYRDYTVTAYETPAILSFKAAGTVGTIDEATRTIKIIVPPGTNMSSVPVDITMAAGSTITPSSGSSVDFSNPVTFTVTSSKGNVVYTVTAIDETADKAVAFLGNYNSATEINNGDELAAYNWLKATYPKAEFVSMSAVKNGTANLSKFGVIWWHEDLTQTLPDIAFDNAVITAINNYRNAGGNLLLTTFAARWIEQLGIVPPFKGPNNVFGDPLGKQWQDNNNNWGISINKDHADHPLFSGLSLASDKPYPVVYLLDKAAFRLNHVSWWKVNEWGNYGDAAGWRSQTGGIDLAGPDGSDNTNSNITIAEWPKSASHGSTIVITPGSYDWFAENNPSTGAPSPANSYLPAVQKLTKNAIEYLKKQ